MALTPLTANGHDNVIGSVYDFTYSTSWAQGFPRTTTGYTYINDPITSSVANLDTGLGLPGGANNTAYYYATLTSPDSDFLSMDTLSCRYSSVDFNTYADDTGFLGMVVTSPDSGGITLAAYDSGGKYQGLDRFTNANGFTETGNDTGNNIQGGSGTAPAYDKTVAFTYVNTTATKANWDSAVARILYGDIKLKGADGASIVLVDFELTGTYTVVQPRAANTERLIMPPRAPLHVGALW